MWGGLWCLPEFASATRGAGLHPHSRSARPTLEPQPLAALEHAFTHFDLTITPLLVRCAGGGCRRGGGAQPLV